MFSKLPLTKQIDAQTARHYNTLQHTATHYNTLQHTATHYNTPHYIAAHCNTFSESPLPKQIDARFVHVGRTARNASLCNCHGDER